MVVGLLGNPKLNDYTRKVVFRTDASVQIGTGHVMRCLTLADALRERGFVCVFICRLHPGNLLKKIAQRGYQAIGLPAVMPGAVWPIAGPPHAHWLGSNWTTDVADTLDAIGKESVDWLVVDHYALDAKWERCLRPACQRLLAIDDLADRLHDCDLLLDQNWRGVAQNNAYHDLVPESCVCLLGPQFALLSSEYMQLRKHMPQRDGNINRILVFVGGSDPTNQTGKILEALMAPTLLYLTVYIVIGINHPNPEDVKRQAKMRANTIVHEGLPTLANIMIRVDLMVGAGGVTTWERMCLGLPAIVMSIAENQVAINLALMKAGHINYLGMMQEVDTTAIISAVEYLTANPRIMQEQSRLGQELVSGAGAVDLAERMLQIGQEQSCRCTQ